MDSMLIGGVMEEAERVTAEDVDELTADDDDDDDRMAAL